MSKGTGSLGVHSRRPARPVGDRLRSAPPVALQQRDPGAPFGRTVSSQKLNLERWAKPLGALHF